MFMQSEKQSTTKTKNLNHLDMTSLSAQFNSIKLNFIPKIVSIGLLRQTYWFLSETIITLRL